MVIVWLLCGLAGCNNTQPVTQSPEIVYSQTPLYQQDLYQHQNTRLVGRVSQGPNQPTMLEREALARLIEQINVLMPLVREAELNRRPDQRLPFRYDWLKDELRKIQRGIREYLGNESFYPVDAYDMPDQQVRGIYQLKQPKQAGH
jgi:RAQPRD family integrative conjugative element protein